VKTVTRKQAVKMIQDSKGKMFGILFKKRTDGSLREMNCRIGVTKHLKGGESTINQGVQKLISVYDVQNAGYRCIPHEGIRQVRIDGEVYKVRSGT